MVEEQPMFSITTLIEIPFSMAEGSPKQICPFNRPDGKVFLKWESRQKEYGQRILDETEKRSSKEGRSTVVAMCDIFEWKDVEWIAQQLAEYWHGNILLNGEEVKVTVDVLRRGFSPDHVQQLFALLILACQPPLDNIIRAGDASTESDETNEAEEAETLRGKSPEPSTSPSAPETTTTVESAPPIVVWDERVDTLSQEEKDAAGIPT